MPCSVHIQRVNPLLILLAGAALFFSACSQEKYPGYKHLDGQTYYQLIELGENQPKAKPGDYITVLLKYYTPKDSLFFDGERRFQLEESPYKGSIDDCLAQLAAGDSASFILSANEFFQKTLTSTRPEYLDSTDYMRIDVRMVNIEDSITFARNKEAFLHWIEDFSGYEKVILKQYLQEHNIRNHPIDSLYYIPLAKGTGEYPENGDTLTLEFEGRFLDGTYFDSTVKRHEPFVFVLGQKWQVIQGLDRAVRLMRNGERAIFILPSNLAFGEQGSSTGIVPPYTTVIFEVELQELKPGRRQDEKP
ncbi:MAG: hypothetical protein CSA97_00765 [Bacteroidetes bacterium]|nr:MAG: hypothetical protein CSA97_00765 [Bacteroidota bacterium]